MTEHRPLKALDQLGAELDRAVRADHDRRDRRRFSAGPGGHGPRRRSRRPPWRRTGLFATILVLLSAGVAVATGLVLGTDDPIAPPAAVDLGPEVRPVAGSGKLAGTPSSDPGGNQPWDVRVSRTAGGEACTAVGQTYEGRFGIVGLDRRFRELPLGVADTCGEAPTGARVQLSARTVIADDTSGSRTIVAGVAGPGVTSVAVGANGVPSEVVEIGPNRGFVRAFQGPLENARPTVRVTASDGSARTIRLADTGKDVAPDPDGGAPWQVEIGKADGCAQAQRVKPSQSPDGSQEPIFTDIVCPTRHRGIAVAVRRFTPVALQPIASRVVVWGRAGRDVAALELRVPGQTPRPLPIGQHGRSILAVLDGHVDPRRVVLRVRLKNGRLRTQRGSTALLDERGRRLREPVVPAYRPAGDPHPRRNDSLIARTVPGTVRTSGPIADPAGGPAWVLRTFVSRPQRPLRDGRRAFRRLSCFAVGRVADGVVRRPNAAGDGPVLTLDDRTANCVQPVRPERIPADVTSYATGTTEYAPRIGRFVVSGTVPTATRLELLGARGGPRAVPVGPGGAFLAVLAPEDVPGPLRIRARFADGTSTVSDRLPTGRGSRAAVAIRTADPDGAAPWIMTARRTPRQTCVEQGQLLAGSLVSIDPVTGRVDPRPAGSTCFFGRNFGPIAYNMRDIPSRSTVPTPAQVRRRTLGGRTLVYGLAAPGVTSLVVRTPRDVRTVRPVGPNRLYLLVYDGGLTGGFIDITPYRGHAAMKVVRIPILF
jgi:hypothetical protein